jgi:hypothetical protein
LSLFGLGFLGPSYKFPDIGPFDEEAGNIEFLIFNPRGAGGDNNAVDPFGGNIAF